MTNEEFLKQSYGEIKKKYKSKIDAVDAIIDEAINIEISKNNSIKDIVYPKQITNNSKKFTEENILNDTSFIDYFKQNNFEDLFKKACLIKKNDQDRDSLLAPFFSLITEGSLKRIFKANRMIDFLDQLENFLNNDLFNEHEKRSFFNGQFDLCLLYSLNIKNFNLAKIINKYRKEKYLNNFHEYISRKMKEAEYEILDNLFELSDSVTVNNSQYLRLFYASSCRNFDKINYFINKYSFDINGLGNLPGISNKYTFAHSVVETDGTKGAVFFEKFIKEFNNKIDFDIQAWNEYKKQKSNLLELLINSQLEVSIKLNRLAIILKHCCLSEKHIASIVQYLVDINNEVIIKHYDNDVYDILFSHEKFNSQLYDREAFLNKLLTLDNYGQLHLARQNSNFTVNPTSVILDKFIKNAKSALPMQQHPLITWVRLQNEYYSRDTFKSLMHFYKDEIHGFDFKGIKINSVLAQALEENGMNIPQKNGMFSFLRKKKPIVNKVMDKPIETNMVEVKKLIDKLEFNNVLFEQVKDNEVKRYIDSIILNAEQFDMLTSNKNDMETVHYMHHLLPKFLNKTIDNYLHFSTVEEEENAKNNVLVQLKLINKKTFEVLTQSLDYEKNQILKDGSIHHKVMLNY